MYRRILVAVDGSHTSEIALHEAVNLAKEMEGQLLIVHAVDDGVLIGSEYANPAEIWSSMVEAGRKILDKAHAAASRAGVKADVKLIEIEGLGRRVPEAIAEEADAWPADIIVVGTHGRHGLSRVFMGSVAEGIARVSTKPVLLIHGQ
jgi:nucleotide-binding universal stress UspA family protein